MRDPLDTLRTFRDAQRDTVGMTAHDVAVHEVRSIDDVLIDLDRLKNDGLVSVEKGPMGTEWWTTTEDGERELATAERGIAAAREAESDRLL